MHFALVAFVLVLDDAFRRFDRGVFLFPFLLAVVVLLLVWLFFFAFLGVFVLQDAVDFPVYGSHHSGCILVWLVVDVVNIL